MQRASTVKFSIPLCFLIVTVIVSSMLLSGCRAHHGDDTSPIVTLVNADPDSTGMKVYVHGRAVFSGSDSAGPARNYRVDAGSYDVTVEEERGDADPQTLLSEHVRLEAGRSYTVVAYQAARRSPARARILSSAAHDGATSDKAALRVINASRGQEKVDVCLNSVVTFPSLGFADESATVPIDPGRYRISVLDAASSYRPLCEPKAFDLHKGDDYLLVIAGNAASGGLTEQLVEN